MNLLVKGQIKNVLLADDDEDDRLIFSEAIKDLPFPINLTTVSDGVALMRKITEWAGALPCVVFLDLNMPLKNGFECLKEIKGNPLLKKLKVVIYSTSYEPGIVHELFESGAEHYLRKPSEFNLLKDKVHHTLENILKANGEPTTIENFVIYA